MNGETGVSEKRSECKALYQAPSPHNTCGTCWLGTAPQFSHVMRGEGGSWVWFTGEKCLIVRYQATWHKVNSTWRQSRPSFVYSRRKKKNWSPRIRHLFKWPGLFSILLFLLFLWNSFTAMFAFWFTGCDFQRTYFWGYNMFPFFNGLILHKNTRCLEVILFVFSNFITQ